MDISEEDNTAVLRMKRDFKSFLSKEKSGASTSRSHLPLGESFLDNDGSKKNASASVSVHEILGKYFVFGCNFYQ